MPCIFVQDVAQGVKGKSEISWVRFRKLFFCVHIPSASLQKYVITDSGKL